MPLKRCTNSEGKKGWSWGDGGCQVAGSDLESKKQAIRVAIKTEGPENFKKIMKSEGSTAFGGSDGLLAAKAALDELVASTKPTAFSAIASYLSTATKVVEVDNAGDLSESDAQANDKGDTYGENGRQDGDGDEADPPAKADLDTPTVKVGSHTVVPPYNKDASPETDPADESQYEPPTRDDLEPATADKTITEVPESEDIVRKSTMGSAAEEAVWSSIAYISQDERDKIPEEDFAGPHRSFPCATPEQIKNAAHLVGHSKNPTAVKRRIIEIAKRKNMSHALPQSWRGPDEQAQASIYEQTLALFANITSEERKSLSEKLLP